MPTWCIARRRTAYRQNHDDVGPCLTLRFLGQHVTLAHDGMLGRFIRNQRVSKCAILQWGPSDIHGFCHGERIDSGIRAGGWFLDDESFKRSSVSSGKSRTSLARRRRPLPLLVASAAESCVLETRRSRALKRLPSPPRTARRHRSGACVPSSAHRMASEQRRGALRRATWPWQRRADR